MEPLGGGWRASVHYSRPNTARTLLDRLLAVRGDRFLDAYPREAERRRAAGRFDLPLAMAISLLLHGAIFLMPFPASNARTAGIPDEALLPEHRMVFLSLGGAPREAEPAPASMPDVAETAEPERAAADAAVAALEEAEAASPPAERAPAAEAPPASTAAPPATATTLADAPLPAAATIPPDTTTEASASPLAEVPPAAVEAASPPAEIVPAAAPAAEAVPTTANAAEAAASTALARVEAQPAASSAARPIEAKPAPVAAFKPGAATAALLARPRAPSAIAREAAGTSSSAAALSAARAGMAAPASAQPAPIAAAATQVPAIMAMPESEPPAFLVAAPLGVASGFFSPRAERIGDTARPVDPDAPEIANPADPSNSADALFAGGQAGALPSEAGNSMGRMTRGASQAVSSGAAIAASNRDAVDDRAERQARTFSAAIRKSPLPHGAAPASVPASASVSGSASARSEPFPAPAIQPQSPFEAPVAVATDIPSQAALSQTAQTVQTALQAPASLTEAQAPSPAVPPAAIAETVAAAPAAASPSEVLEFPARAAPATVEQTVPAQAAPVVPGPQEVLDLLSSLIAGRKAYPEAARRRKAQGSVGLALKVAADGSLASARIEKKSGSAILDRAALDLVKGLFPLALRPGEPMEIALSIEYRLVN